MSYIPDHIFQASQSDQLRYLKQLPTDVFASIPNTDLHMFDFFEVVEPAIKYHQQLKEQDQLDMARSGTMWMVFGLIACGVAVTNLWMGNGTGSDLYIWASMAAVFFFMVGGYAKLQDPRIQSVGDAAKLYPYTTAAVSAAAASWLLDEVTDKVADRVIEKTKKANQKR